MYVCGLHYTHVDMINSGNEVTLYCIYYCLFKVLNTVQLNDQYLPKMRELIPKDIYKTVQEYQCIQEQEVTKWLTTKETIMKLCIALSQLVSRSLQKK